MPHGGPISGLFRAPNLLTAAAEEHLPETFSDGLEGRLASGPYLAVVRMSQVTACSEITEWTALGYLRASSANGGGIRSSSFLA
jgi:hypothetical protein